MGIFRPRAKPDLSLLKGVRVYGPVKQLSGYGPLVDPAPDAFPLRYRSPYFPLDSEPPTRKFQQYDIHNSAVIEALNANGYTCQPLHPGEDSPWYLVDIRLEHGEQITLRDGSVLIAWGSALKTIQEDKEQDAERGILTYPLKTCQQSPDKDRATWGLTAREAAGALISVFGQRSAPPTPEPIGDSSSGIEPCGYGEL